MQVPLKSPKWTHWGGSRSLSVLPTWRRPTVAVLPCAVVATARRGAVPLISLTLKGRKETSALMASEPPSSILHSHPYTTAVPSTLSFLPSFPSTLPPSLPSPHSTPSLPPYLFLSPFVSPSLLPWSLIPPGWGASLAVPSVAISPPGSPGPTTVHLVALPFTYSEGIGDGRDGADTHVSKNYC